jgi:hypothetical protein
VFTYESGLPSGDTTALETTALRRIVELALGLRVVASADSQSSVLLGLVDASKSGGGGADQGAGGIGGLLQERWVFVFLAKHLIVHRAPSFRIFPQSLPEHWVTRALVMLTDWADIIHRYKSLCSPPLLEKSTEVPLA